MNIIGRQLSFFDLFHAPVHEIKGRNIAITGGVGPVRERVREWIIACGGNYHTSVTSTTDYLVVGEIRKAKNISAEGTRKLCRARELIEAGGSIKLLTPDELFRGLEACTMHAEAELWQETPPTRPRRQRYQDGRTESRAS